jgi:pilus assembly protein TadC
LPESWQGQKLSWTYKVKDNGPVLWISAMFVAILIYLLADKDLHDEVEQRKLLMKREYPDVVHKLVLYLGAGMTIRGTFHKVAEEYEQSRVEGKGQCPVYEEMLHTCRELKSGMSEAVAYEHFGKRTGLQEYVRLSTLLTQNLKKGNNTLLQRLREEATKASIERIQYAKRLAEEAVTKLLIPMVLMLLVVMLMIMIPAFSSVGA